jgi:uncharacterized membrane protein YhaH (DUF805 family)
MPLADLLFSFKGRIPRRPYWLFTLALAIVMLGPVIFVFGLGTNAADTYFNLSGFVLLWPTLAVQVKRWHDRDKSGWWVLVNFVPFIGSFWSLMENGFMEGTPSANRFGPNPLHQANET